MDLAGNAPVFVMADANLEQAVEACVSGAFGAAGQNCIGTQRILIEHAVYDAFHDAFVARTACPRCGDPRDEATDLGPMITEAALGDRGAGGRCHRLWGTAVDRQSAGWRALCANDA